MHWLRICSRLEHTQKKNKIKQNSERNDKVKRAQRKKRRRKKERREKKTPQTSGKHKIKWFTLAKQNVCSLFSLLFLLHEKCAQKNICIGCACAYGCFSCCTFSFCTSHLSKQRTKKRIISL